MTITTACSNGHNLLAAAELAGSTLPCPACGEAVVIPAQTNDQAAREPNKAGGNTASLARGLRVFARRTLGIAIIIGALIGCWLVFLGWSGDDPAVADKLNQIGIAFVMHHSDKGAFFVPRRLDVGIRGSNLGPPPTALSWRVHLLPYLGQKPLYDRFHLDESWDSPHNLTLLEYMPEVYRLSGGDDTTTRFQVFNGPDMLLGPAKPTALRDISDGPRNTILTLVVGAELACVWTKPDDLKLDRQDPFKSIGTITGSHIATTTTDARVLMLPADIEPSQLVALATPQGHEIIDADSYRREYVESEGSLIPTLRRMLLGE